MYKNHVEKLLSIDYSKYDKESLIFFLDNIKSLTLEVSKELNEIEKNDSLSSTVQVKLINDLFYKFISAMPVASVYGRVPNIDTSSIDFIEPKLLELNLVTTYIAGENLFILSDKDSIGIIILEFTQSNKDSFKTALLKEVCYNLHRIDSKDASYLPVLDKGEMKTLLQKIKHVLK